MMVRLGNEAGTMKNKQRLMVWWMLAVAAVGGCAEELGTPEAPPPDMERSARKLSSHFPVSAKRVTDLRPGDKGSAPSSLTAVGTTLFFSAFDDTTGAQVWASDGTEAGTTAQRRLEMQPSIPYLPGRQAAMNGAFFFTAYEQSSGYELWKSDGTAAGTVRLTDLAYDSIMQSATSLTASGGMLYFIIPQGTGTDHLWRSNGTPGGTVFVTSLASGVDSRFGESLLTAMGGTLYYSCYTSVGYELCKLDPVNRAHVQVKDIYDMYGSSLPSQLTVVDGTLFLEANDGVGGRELWKSDGTNAGTVRVRDIRPGSTASGLASLTAVGSTLFFVANDGVSGTELWKSDGTEAGTVRVRDISPGAMGSSARNLVDVGGILFFVADDGVSGTELWKSDGTEAGTVRVRDIRPGAEGSHPASLVNGGEALLFTANDGVAGEELWKSDGTEAGTVRVRDIMPGAESSGASSLTRVGDSVFFAAEDGLTGRELWKSDGTEAGTVRVRNIRKMGASSSDPVELTELNGTLFFRADNGGDGPELWKSDGTQAGTVRVRDILPGGRGSTPSLLTSASGLLFFAADDGATGEELWKSDGTQAGTVRLRDIRPGVAASYPDALVNVGGQVFFSASDGVVGTELWKSDGTEAGTVLVKDISTVGIYESTTSPYTLFPVGRRLYLRADDHIKGEELWKSDGTPASTVLVKDIYPGSTGSVPWEFASVGDTLYFSASDGTGRALWKSDGSAAGTVKVANVNPSYLFGVGNTLFFQGRDAAGDSELWKSDGTAAGTVRVRDIKPGSAGSDPRPQIALEGILYFLVYSNGFQLWKSDGTEAGTVRVDPRLSDSGVAWNGGIALSTYVEGVGQELWWTDGTPEGTRLLADVSPGPDSSHPRELTVVGDTLYFSADDGQSGRELWSVVALTDTTPPTVTCPESFTAEAVGPQGATGVYPPASATDDFPGAPTVSYSHPSGGDFPLGATSVTVTATDEAGHSATCVFTVTVSDTRAPDLSCPEAVEAVATSAEGATVEYPPASAADAVSTAQVTYSQASGTTFDLGGNTVTVTATDSAGNAASCAFNVTVNPPAPPSITCPATVVAEATGADGATVLWPSATASGMEPMHVTYSQASGSRFPLGTRVVTATARDALERTASCEFSVVVHDTTAPALTCPTAMTAEARNAQGATVEYLAATVSDAVSAPVTVRYSHASGTLFSLGATTVSVAATDAAGNAGTCSFTVTVRDTTPPELSCPGDIVVEATDMTGADVMYPAAAPRDSVSGTAVTVASSAASGSHFGFGATPVRITATDTAGNSAECSFTVTVRDTTAPALACPANLVAEAQRPEGADVSLPFATATDAGSSAVEVVYGHDGPLFPLGATEVFVTARDASGNTSTCSFIVTVRDTTPPELGCPASVQVEAQSDQGAMDVSLTGTPPSDAVTRAPTVSSSHPSGTPFPLGTTEVTFTATDEAGNAGTCSFTVTVRDTTAPVLSCPADIVLLTWKASGIEVDYAEAITTDAVSSPSRVYSQASGTRFPLGTTPVTVTATDAAGNSASCEFHVTVQPPREPIFVDPPQELGWGCNTSSGSPAGLGWGALLLLVWGTSRRRLARPRHNSDSGGGRMGCATRP
ncbi:ELWxxDGT repeat protein [Myxococcus sp. CA040A]|uniref:ELWxxDGT repeat protein n=1 Tax=Myxococcus sp. CA040A TaxID=2741738 RepID=UPI00157B6EEE|nr:ELWxxDGT repeat protein [Myxococcus sp. CA040A]NTX07362.1 HYR domain-containing protein [Myxococcus sp. CA040A]